MIQAQSDYQNIKDKFTADTCQIERDLNFEKEIWPNSEYYIYILEIYAYDDLGDKYARLLVSKLNEMDAMIFGQTQLHWIAFYNSQVHFLGSYFPSPKYEMILAEMTKNRAIAIYKYLLLASEIKIN